MAGFVKVHNSIFRALRDVQTLGAAADLIAFGDSCGWMPFDASDSFLVERWGISKRQVRNLISRLESMGVLVIESSGGRVKSRQIRVFDPSPKADHLADKDQNHLADHQADHLDPLKQGACEAERTTTRTTDRTTKRTTKRTQVPDYKEETRPDSRSEETEVSVKPDAPKAKKADPIREPFDRMAALWSVEANAHRETLRVPGGKKLRRIDPPEWSSTGKNTTSLKALLNAKTPEEDVALLIRWHWRGPDDARNREKGRGFATLHTHRIRYTTIASDWADGFTAPPKANTSAASWSMDDAFAAMDDGPEQRDFMDVEFSHQPPLLE